MRNAIGVSLKWAIRTKVLTGARSEPVRLSGEYAVRIVLEAILNTSPELLSITKELIFDRNSRKRPRSTKHSSKQVR